MADTGGEKFLVKFVPRGGLRESRRVGAVVQRGVTAAGRGAQRSVW